MMQNWTSGSEVYGNNDGSSFYGVQENYYHPDKGGYQSYGGGFQQPVEYNNPPVVNNAGFHCLQQAPLAYQQPMSLVSSPVPAYTHHQPSVPMNPAFMEQPYPLPNYPPCQGPPGGPWNYSYCYGFYGEAPCPYVDVIDMEDFM